MAQNLKLTEAYVTIIANMIYEDASWQSLAPNYEDKGERVAAYKARENNTALNEAHNDTMNNFAWISHYMKETAFPAMIRDGGKVLDKNPDGSPRKVEYLSIEFTDVGSLKWKDYNTATRYGQLLGKKSMVDPSEIGSLENAMKDFESCIESIIKRLDNDKVPASADIIEDKEEADDEDLDIL